MTREEYLKRLIDEKGCSIKKFALLIDMPYSTLLSILGGKLGGASLDNIMRICSGLDISVADLERFENDTFDMQKLHLSYNYDKLNDDGKEKLAGLSDDLLSIDKYRK